MRCICGRDHNRELLGFSIMKGILGSSRRKRTLNVALAILLPCVKAMWSLVLKFDWSRTPQGIATVLIILVLSLAQENEVHGVPHITQSKWPARIRLRNRIGTAASVMSKLSPSIMSKRSDCQPGHWLANFPTYPAPAKRSSITRRRFGFTLGAGPAPSPSAELP